MKEWLTLVEGPSWTHNRRLASLARMVGDHDAKYNLIVGVGIWETLEKIELFSFPSFGSQQLQMASVMTSGSINTWLVLSQVLHWPAFPCQWRFCFHPA